jgi:hypothetical protein
LDLTVHREEEGELTVARVSGGEFRRGAQMVDLRRSPMVSGGDGVADEMQKVTTSSKSWSVMT